jgi:putative intracellular protease/amidase
MSEAKRVLIVVTSHHEVGTTGRRTGYYLNEVAVPYYAFKEAGYVVDIASPTGGPVAPDPGSLAAGGEAGSPSALFLTDPDAQAKVTSSLSTRSVAGGDYVGIFIAGGHGAMWDLPGDEMLAQLVAELLKRGDVVGAVCHGPAGLTAAQGADDTPVLNSRTVTGFTDAEEGLAGLAEQVPFLLETRMRELGGRFIGAAPWAEHAVRDGNLVTGQNPASCARTAALMVEAMSELVPVGETTGEFSQ